MARRTILIVNDFLLASVVLRQVTLLDLRLQAMPFAERALTNFVPLGSVSVTTTVCAACVLWLATFSVSVNRDPRGTDFGALTLTAVSTTRCALRSPRTPCWSTPG